MKMKKLHNQYLALVLFIFSTTNLTLASEWQGTVNGIKYNFSTITNYYSSIVINNPNAFTSNPWWGKYYSAPDGAVTFARAVALNLGGSYVDPIDKAIYGPLFAFGAFQNPTLPGILNIDAAVYSFDPTINAEFWSAGSPYRSNKIETYVFATEALSN